MAITASLIDKIVPAYTIGGYDLPLVVYNEVNSATYKVGAPLIDSSGQLTESTSSLSGTNLTMGIATQAGQNIASAPVYPSFGVVYPSGSTAGSATSTAGSALSVAPLVMCLALPHVVFEGTFANNNADVAINTSDLFTNYGLTKDSTSGFWYVDKNRVTTNAAVKIIAVKSPSDVTFGTTKGVRVLFLFRSTVTIFN